MPYTADKPDPNPSAEELRARIPGWGVDLDHADRPAWPKAPFDPGASGAHWVFPERQPERVPRERSIEHGMLPPVFGTAQPLHGLSGLIRRFAYARFSEGRAAHWLLLIGADRVEVLGASLRSIASPHPDDPVTETGVLSEFRATGFPTRFGQHRSDLKHTWLDPLFVAAPYLVAGVLMVRLVRALRVRRR